MKNTIPHLTITIWCIMLSSGCNNDDPVNPTSQEPLITQVGIPTGNASSISLDATGGTLTSADGILQITIPAGAVSTTTDFTIQPITNYCPSGYGLSYRLLPEDIIFTQPVTLTFSYPDTLPANEYFLKIAYQHDDGTWFSPKVATLDVTNNTIRVQTQHFSDWSIFPKLKISPYSGSAKVNENFSLKVTFIGELSTITDAQGAEINQLNIDPNVSTIWEATDGTIAKQGEDRALFTAPSTVPDYNPVEVTATYHNVSFTLNGQTFTNPQLRAKINVFGDEVYFQVVFTSSRSLQPVADSWFTETDQGSMKILVQGDSVTIYDRKNNKAEVVPGSIYDPGNECTHTLLEPGDGPYHIADSIPFGGFYLAATHSVYLGVGGTVVPTGKTPSFEEVCSGSHHESGGLELPTFPGAFYFDANLEYQEIMSVIPGGGAFPDGFLKTAVTRIR